MQPINSLTEKTSSVPQATQKQSTLSTSHAQSEQLTITKSTVITPTTNKPTRILTNNKKDMDEYTEQSSIEQILPEEQALLADDEFVSYYDPYASQNTVPPIESATVDDSHTPSPVWLAGGILAGAVAIGNSHSGGNAFSIRPINNTGSTSSNTGGSTTGNTGSTDDNTGSNTDNNTSTDDNTGSTGTNTDNSNTGSTDGSTTGNTGSTDDNTGSNTDNNTSTDDNTGSTGTNTDNSTGSNTGSSTDNNASTDDNTGSTGGSTTTPARYLAEDKTLGSAYENVDNVVGPSLDSSLIGTTADTVSGVAEIIQITSNGYVYAGTSLTNTRLTERGLVIGSPVESTPTLTDDGYWSIGGWSTTTITANMLGLGSDTISVTFGDTVDTSLGNSITLGTLKIDGVETNTATIEQINEGKVVYTSPLRFAITNYTIDYTATTASGKKTADSITFAVDPVIHGHTPVGEWNTVTVAKNSSHTFSNTEIPFKDQDGDHLSNIIIDRLPEHGTLYLNGEVVPLKQRIWVADFNDFTYVPDGSGTGEQYDKFSYTIIDTIGNESMNGWWMFIDVVNADDTTIHTNPSEVNYTDVAETVITSNTQSGLALDMAGGNDTLTINNNVMQAEINLGNGDDTLNLTGLITESTLIGGNGNDTIFIGDGSTLTNTVIKGGYGDDAIIIGQDVTLSGVLIDGGTVTHNIGDTDYLILSSDLVLDGKENSMVSIDTIDMRDGINATLTLTADQVIANGETQLRIFSNDDGDIINLDGNFTNNGYGSYSVTDINGTVYTVFDSLHHTVYLTP